MISDALHRMAESLRVCNPPSAPRWGYGVFYGVFNLSLLPTDLGGHHRSIMLLSAHQGQLHHAIIQSTRRNML